MRESEFILSHIYIREWKLLILFPWVHPYRRGMPHPLTHDNYAINTVKLAVFQTQIHQNLSSPEMDPCTVELCQQNQELIQVQFGCSLG